MRRQLERDNDKVSIQDGSKYNNTNTVRSEDVHSNDNAHHNMAIDGDSGDISNNNVHPPIMVESQQSKRHNVISNRIVPTAMDAIEGQGTAGGKVPRGGSADLPQGGGGNAPLKLRRKIQEQVNFDVHQQQSLEPLAIQEEESKQITFDEEGEDGKVWDATDLDDTSIEDAEDLSGEIDIFDNLNSPQDNASVAAIRRKLYAEGAKVRYQAKRNAKQDYVYSKNYAFIARQLIGWGHTYADISRVLGVPVWYINYWIETKSDFALAIKQGTQMQLDATWKSMFKMANGFTRKETIHFKTKTGIISKVVDKFYPPNPYAAYRLLQLRDPDVRKNSDSGQKLSIIQNNINMGAYTLEELQVLEKAGLRHLAINENYDTAEPVEKDDYEQEIEEL